MGISEESVNLNFKWHKLSKKTKVFLIICLVFAFSLIRFSFNTEYIGYFAGECGQGMCHTEYKITSNELTIDDTSTDTATNVHKVIKGNFEDLKFNAPLLLLSNIWGSFGCPDCSDGGGYILGFKFFWIHFSFEFDRDSSPWYYAGATEIIRDRIKKIEQIEAAQSNP
ncbi:hypothetical protein [Mucilaginibacter sp.]|jgi:hypothetical protein|uniref:hypothetical protein n=1 Tax=Mucilaginibacter sp. TaxID=1882438 RepID=UPI00260C87B9|nr:hypothetical protein [Mucilaginibacter sp.]MDB5129480.1 hypothetical protein [Mucilaginibacter sp.]